MVSTGWRTACTVIVIVVGAAFLTFAVFVYRRQKLTRRFPNAPEMQQRFMRSYAGDPEAHMPLLDTEAFPPLPPKTEYATHRRTMVSGDWAPAPQWDNRSSFGGVYDWGTKVRDPPSRVPVPSMFPDPMGADEEERHSYHFTPDTAFSMPKPEPEPTPRAPFFHLPPISLPRIQIKTDGKKSRLPSLRIEFLRESNKVVSEAVSDWTHVSHDASSISTPSTNGRPFATMSSSPLPHIPRVSPISTIDISRGLSPPLPPEPSERTESVTNSLIQSDVSSPVSVQEVGHNLFLRKMSTEEASFQTISRNSSAQGLSRTPSGRPLSDPPRLNRTFSTSSGSSGSGASSGRGNNLKRTSTWVPNVLASYSPWHGVVPGTSREGREPIVSPTGQWRVADAYRRMPTLEETPETTPATVPTALPTAASSPSYMEEDPLPLPPQLAAMEPPPRPPEGSLQSHPAQQPSTSVGS